MKTEEAAGNNSVSSGMPMGGGGVVANNYIGNSRNDSFIQMVKEGTNYKGCELVVSCLSGKLMEELRRMVSEGIEAGHVRPLTRVTLAGREVSRAARMLASGYHRGRVLLKPEHHATLLKITLSDSASYAVVCGDHELGLELIDRLICRGAKKLLVHYKQKCELGYLKAKLATWRNMDANIKIVEHDLQTYSNVLDYLQQSEELGHVEGIFLIDESNDIGGESPAEHLDEAARKLCMSLK
ncbi:Fatty acid synthase [Eumeta japonica]|uniref:Fatty acid synthase n=1 Tax=Eumeta variegata TaxID=151549 RepID=A0A4C1ZYE6_EUMVA|nr:Fatty acid synthase [Eumeta japonica]